MKPSFRHYCPYQDETRVSVFLEQTCPPTGPHPNWLRPRWEYMLYSCQEGKQEQLTPIGLWEAGETLVGMVNFEEGPGEAYFQIHPDYPYLKADMLAHAEANLCKVEDGKKHLTLYINAFDAELEQLAQTAGLVKAVNDPQITAQFDIGDDFPAISLPDGFRLTDRAENNDLHKINRVLWRGFNHEGPPPEKYVAGRADVEKAPLFGYDLVVMVEAANGDLVSYCGIWYVPANKLAYVEPVATDPAYRRKGLGKAAVLEAVRRAGALGAARAIVGSGQEFYRAIGFRPIFSYFPWHKQV